MTAGGKGLWKEHLGRIEERLGMRLLVGCGYSGALEIGEGKEVKCVLNARRELFLCKRTSVRMLVQESFLPSIDPEYFERDQLTAIEASMKHVTELPMNDNLISQVTKIRLPGCKLTRFPLHMDFYVYIRELDLAENEFTSLPKDALMTFSNLNTLDLSGNKLESLDINFPESLDVIDLSFNEKLDVKSMWQVNLPNLHTLKLTHCKLTDLPSEVPRFASTLKELHLDGNLLTEIPKVVGQFSSLEELSLFGNKCVAPLSEALPQELKSVVLSYNDITDWEYGTELNCHAIHLNGNPITTFPTKILDIATLRGLFLAHCNIEGVLDFAVPEHVTIIDLSFNKISGISEAFAQCLPRLTHINLANNELTEIPDFEGSINAMRVYLDDNKLKRIPQAMMKGTRVEIFSISHNEIESISEFDFPRLREMNLSFNKLTQLPDSFGSAQQLSHFNVAFNQLETLPQSLGGCRKVFFLNASYNKLVKIPACVLCLSQLRGLNLAGNRLTNVPIGCGAFFFLRTLDISNNNYRSLPTFFTRLKALKYLNVSHNAIEELPEGFELAPAISVVDFSFNKLKSFNVKLAQAWSVNLDYNQLTEFDLSLVPAVRFLALSHNNIERRIVDQLFDLYGIEKLGCYEFINNTSKTEELEHLKFHVISDISAQPSDIYGVGYAATLGERATMEDAVALANYGDDQFMYAVFDGHTGNVAAATAANCLIHEVKAVVKGNEEQISEGFAESFARVNEQLKRLRVSDGCTTAAAVISKGKCYAAGVGDSRIIRVRKDSVERITTDHKPLYRPEFERLRESSIAVTGEGRINRKLAVARALGDFTIGDRLFVKPDISSFEIDDDDVALVIACDGLWDVVSDEVAAELVRKSQSAGSSAVTLKNCALALGSKDNISVIVVDLHPGEENSGFPKTNTVELIPIVEESPDEEDCLSHFPTLPARRRR